MELDSRIGNGTGSGIENRIGNRMRSGIGSEIGSGTEIKKEQNKSTPKTKKDPYAWVQWVFVLILALYPLRHIYWGLDLWDTGYNYANFEYMGTEHMDTMWLFSTYLANAVGNFLTKLPFASSLAGMNFYTGLSVSALALMGYFFCTRKLNISPIIAFAGEFAAISLCWCPTALLYNYLTYLLLLGCVILLYIGLAEEKKWCLFTAGICLGTNILVRFSNLPEAAMIVAVWAYGVIEALEWRKENKANPLQVSGKSGAWGRTVRRTLWCLGGYLSSLAVLFGYIGMRYGLDEYAAGITRLFAMTDKATDYKATSMLMGIIDTYVENLYWFVRIAVIVLAGICICALIKYTARYVGRLAKWEKAEKISKILCYAVCILLAVAMLVWLYARGFCSVEFFGYGSMLRPGILFLMLTMFIAVVRIFNRNSPKEEKLISGIVLLVVLLTSIGSNNKVYPSINNLFVAAPYTLWQCRILIKKGKAREIKVGKLGEITLHPIAVKCIVTAFLGMFLVQITLFGKEFIFVEATGAQDVSVSVDNNEILKGIKMSPEKAEWLTSISAYVQENDLQGREVILYGYIPAMSYYLQMPPAFNSWSELLSYSASQMEKDLAVLASKIDEKGAECPVIILERNYLDHVQTGSDATSALGVAQDKIEVMDTKWPLLEEFIDRYGYEQTFENDKFVILE